MVHRLCGHIASLMIENTLSGEITLGSGEKNVGNNTGKNEYAKPYSGQPFKIN